MCCVVPAHKFDPKIHHRRSIRLKGYDYTQAGAYFVTIVAWQRECLFGEVVDGETPKGGVIRLNDFGVIVKNEWERTAIVRPNVELGWFVVMPNHFHGILIFTNDDAYTVGATRRVAPTKTTLQLGSLGAVMAQFKSIVTKRINILRDVSGAPVWQRNYYERIIRNEREMDRIYRYIESNPSQWMDDTENPANL
jgi:REP element-mobilizing transposase RayT